MVCPASCNGTSPMLASARGELMPGHERPDPEVTVTIVSESPTHLTGAVEVPKTMIRAKPQMAGGLLLIAQSRP
jgi:hypothetical protein